MSLIRCVLLVTTISLTCLVVYLKKRRQRIEQAKAEKGIPEIIHWTESTTPLEPSPPTESKAQNSKKQTPESPITTEDAEEPPPIEEEATPDEERKRRKPGDRGGRPRDNKPIAGEGTRNITVPYSQKMEIVCWKRERQWFVGVEVSEEQINNAE